MEALEYIKKIIRHYAPEWVPDSQNPDLGTAFAEAFSYMLEQNRLLYERMFDKHYYAFLNSMGAQPPPPRGATGFASFKLANGAPHGELVPAGTVLYKDEIPYTVEESVFVTPCALVRAYFSHGDTINDALGSGGTLTVFNKTAPDLQRHEWQISHAWAFSHLEKGSVLEIDFGKPLPVNLEWRYEGDPQKPFEPLESGARKGGTMEKSVPKNPVRLTSPGFAGGDFISAALSCDFKGFSLDKAEIRILAESVNLTRYFHQDAEIACASCMYPFGKTLTQNDCFYIACDEAFSKKDAALTVRFNLSYETLPPDDKLPEKLRGSEPVQLVDFALEYRNGTDFVLLPGYEIKNPVAPETEFVLTFKCPGDMESFVLNGLESRWLRVRILELSYSYEPVKYIVPKLRVNNISYVCDALTPSSVTLINNLRSQTYHGLPGGLEIFTPPPSAGPSVYLGFDKPFGTQQLSMLIDPEEGNPAPGIGKLAFHAYSGGGWLAAQTMDSTERLTVAGLLKVFMSRPPEAAELFGHTLYWLRLDMELGGVTPVRVNDASVGLSIYMNAAVIVQKSAWQREVFTLDDGSAVELRLKERNITDLRVYAAGTELSCCRPDACEGVVLLDPAEMKAYGTPLEVTAEYRATKGFGGNCDPYAITRMADSIGYVQYVTNPLAINDGWSYETSEQMISVGTKMLRHRQRAVAAGDFEALAYEFAGGLIWCKCRMEDNPGALTLAYLPRSYPRRFLENPRPLTAFSIQLKAYLLERCHPALAYGDRLNVREAEYKPLSVSAQLKVAVSKDWQKILEDARDALYAFLDPVTGNFGNTGFGFDEIPDEELLKKFFFSIPDIDNVKVTITEPLSVTQGGLCVYVPNQLEIGLLEEGA